MIQDFVLEIRVIKKFITETKQDRYIQFISTPKNRKKFIRELAHFNDFNFSLLQHNSEIDARSILETLSKNKVQSKTCYIISENVELDTKRLDISQAIEATLGFDMGTILVFGDADIIIYQGEEIKSRYISKSSK
ncbi:MAG TPA: hypothetical protein VGQ53_18940 [Chitinophagaceae bacterium]|jgi:hypothetical protein|nr:hypothetical protein [Chitinophagaceae bacterium]